MEATYKEVINVILEQNKLIYGLQMEVLAIVKVKFKIRKLG